MNAVSTKDAMHGAIAKLKAATSSDPSGLANECLTRIDKGAFGVLHDIINMSAQSPIIYPDTWKTREASFYLRKGTGRS